VGGQPFNNNCRSALLPLKRNPKHKRAAAPYSGASWFDYCVLFYGILKNPMLASHIVGFLCPPQKKTRGPGKMNEV
jgi:hypothetical protein